MASASAFRKRVLKTWGERCLWPWGRCQGPLEVMHAYTRGAHPEWRYEPWNGFPGCVWHHRTATRSFEFDPVSRRALQACADAVREAHEGQRSMPSWLELQALVSQMLLEG